MLRFPNMGNGGVVFYLYLQVGTTFFTAMFVGLEHRIFGSFLPSPFRNLLPSAMDVPRKPTREAWRRS